jgi:D-serine deaminase-like pyridoxal phosphate-dependent protein
MRNARCTIRNGGQAVGSLGIDRAALAGIRAERVDWRFKGLPDSVFGQTLGEVADAGLDLFTDGFVGPLVVLDEAALTHNLTTMADWCARHGMRLAPHGKTTMAPQLFARQLELGAWGMTTANISQLRVYRAFGVRRIQLANELVDPAALRWVAAELDRDADFEFCCWADSVAGVDLMTEALRAADRATNRSTDSSRPVDVLVELGAPGGRSGARDLPTAQAVAEAVAASPQLRLAGVAGYEGALTHDTTADALSLLDAYFERMRALVIRLAADGLFADVPDVIVSAGGSAYFDRVVAALGAAWPDGLRVTPVLRSGAYLTHDDGFYRDISPLGEAVRLTDAPPFRPALRAWAQVTSLPEPDLALLTIGKRDAPFDEGLPEPRLIRTADGVIAPLRGCRVHKMSDQITFLGPERDGDALPVAVGDWIGLGLSHPCTTFDKWRLIPVVGGPHGTTVVDLVHTYF